MTFGTLLVANRGEIAVRVLRAARAAGLRTVAVYSDADRDAPHVREADTAVRLGPAPAAESYLSVAALLEAARVSGADAVHPGYGFLSENAAFARAVTDAGLTWVGPPPAVVDLMGRKDEARRVAVAAGVPVVPAAEGSDDVELARRAVEEIGLPLLVKAAAGGGGKGMRIVRDAQDIPAALAAARREARSAFSDDTLLVERYVENGLHIEVQVIADTHGNVLHLLERDCSVQRRHQKVVEEAPAPTISAAVRQIVTESAVRLAGRVGYVGAGTVEFLVAGEEVFFLEMNTRLQVEHPVTEAITGLDLVELQLLVARGEMLPIAQEDVQARGHAIEARVYAEDPDAGFLPQAGVATTVRWTQRARIDAALEPGQEVTTWYDPMLGKIIVHGTTREAARRALVAAIDDTAVIGVTTNLGFLRRLVDSDSFRDSNIHTAWLDARPDAFPREDPDVAACAAGWVLAEQQRRSDSSHPFGCADGWRLAGPPAPIVLDLDRDGTQEWCHVDLEAGEVRMGERSWQVHPLAAPAGHLRLEIDGLVDEFTTEVAAGEVTVVHHGDAYTFRVREAFGAATDVAGDGNVTAPMPGLVQSLTVAPGQAVLTGDVLGVLEAMKMEVAIKAPLDGVVASIGVAAGEHVKLGQTLFVVAEGSTD
ncbi:acetyl/propionyl/methylcrotonyl-CoA carboxylase subunit alpha [Georgenia sp. AZ-5]|uniref:acetyl/propionyl/methylcrotonyl-CoA carboxylase subunit alpha n=1 Tax=Georgenia sp. AZ-5 TaxID=3367526 RepID=UPI0037548FEC